MIGPLLSVQIRSLLSGLTKQGRKGKGTGALILFGFLYLYLGVVICGAMAFTFSTLVGPYHETGLDWLYFSTAGVMATGLSLFGTVFTTQNQLYDARDNQLLLSMPIPPGIVLLSRMILLLGMNLLFTSIVMVPAMVVYGIFADFRWTAFVGQLLGIFGITMLAQAVSCLLGWLFHLLLKRVNRSLFSIVYMVVFLVAYFSIFGQANHILNSLVGSSQQIAQTVQGAIWPLFAMGMGASGNILYGLAFFTICATCFAAVYLVLSRTFPKTAGSSHVSRKHKRADWKNTPIRNPQSAVTAKELQRFLGTPVYLTNMGLGLLMTVGMTVAAIIFRKELVMVLDGMGLPKGTEVLIVFSILSFLNSTLCISAPSVSLEGKNLWILKSLPISAKEILKAKLSLHIRLTVPVISLSALILCLLLGCGPLNGVLCGILCGLAAVFCGLLGMITGLKWAKFDYISDAYPCKQAVFIVITMFSAMGLPLVLGLILAFTLDISSTLFLLLGSGILAGVCFGFYRLLTGWGIKKWNEL